MTVKPEPQRPYVGVHLILQQDDNILLIRRTVKDQMDGYYACVAGKVDLHESPSRALIREVREEIGITVQETDLKHVLTLHHAHTDYKARKEDVIELYFHATCWAGSPEILEPDKASDIGFYPINCLPQPVPKGLIFAMEAMNSGISYQEV